MQGSSKGKLRYCSILVLAATVLLGVAFPRVRIPVRTAAPRHFCVKERGLLKGISDVTTAKDYSRTLNLKDAAELLRDTNYLYNAVTKESKNNLTEIIQKADAFMRNQDEIWDRDDLKDSLESVVAQDNQFVCLLGGKSTGKTLVIRNFEKTRMGTVFVVNLRRDSDILKGLLKVLEDRVTRVDFLNTEGTIKTAGKLGAIAAEIAGKKVEYERFVKFCEALLSDKNATKSLGALIAELVKNKGDKITLIIDEANIAFTIKPGTTPEKIEAVKDALELFTLLTKESRKV
jgi:hypothetical protein